MTSLSDRTAALIAAGAGAVGWIAISVGTGRREAWDSEWYFSAFLPGLSMLIAWLGYLAPRGAWRWALIPFGAQALVAFVQEPAASLLPLGLIVFAVLGAVSIVPAVVGAFFRRWVDRQTPPTS